MVGGGGRGGGIRSREDPTTGSAAVGLPLLVPSSPVEEGRGEEGEEPEAEPPQTEVLSETGEESQQQEGSAMGAEQTGEVEGGEKVGEVGEEEEEDEEEEEESEGGEQEAGERPPVQEAPPQPTSSVEAMVEQDEDELMDGQPGGVYVPLGLADENVFLAFCRDCFRESIVFQKRSLMAQIVETDDSTTTTASTT